MYLFFFLSSYFFSFLYVSVFLSPSVFVPFSFALALPCSPPLSQPLSLFSSLFLSLTEHPEKQTHTFSTTDPFVLIYMAVGCC